MSRSWTKIKSVSSAGVCTGRNVGVETKKKKETRLKNNSLSRNVIKRKNTNPIKP